MKILAAAILGILAFSPAISQGQDRPTIVLVHGAFADSSSWNGVIEILREEGFEVVAVANPLRGVRKDARYVSDVIGALKGPVLLVGHSYGGSVISSSEIATRNLLGLVYVAAFAPEEGETAASLSARFPGSTLGGALQEPVSIDGGDQDLYIQQSLFHGQFAADVPQSAAEVMAAGQRPVTVAALNEGASTPIWKSVPAWFIYGDQDKNIPPAALAFMARRAHARATRVIPGASHVVMVSRPREVASLIMTAAGAP